MAFTKLLGHPRSELGVVALLVCMQRPSASQPAIYRRMIKCQYFLYHITRLRKYDEIRVPAFISRLYGWVSTTIQA